MQVKISKIAELKGHSGAIYSMDNGPENHLVFSGSSDKILALWNLKTLEAEKFAAQFQSIVYSICHIPEQQILLVGTSEGSIHIIDLLNKKEIKILQHHTEAVFDISYSIKANCFYSAGGDGNFAVCSLSDFTFIQLKKLCDQKVRSIDINEVASEIAVACGDCYIRIFDLVTLEEKKSFIAHTLSANIAKYSPDGKHIITGGRDAHLTIWDSKNYSRIKIIPAHNFAIYDIVYSPNGKLFATASRDKTIKIWDAETFELLVRINKENFDGHSNSVNKLVWSNFKDYLISTGDDRRIMVWDIQKISQ